MKLNASKGLWKNTPGRLITEECSGRMFWKTDPNCTAMSPYIESLQCSYILPVMCHTFHNNECVIYIYIIYKNIIVLCCVVSFVKEYLLFYDVRQDVL